MSLSKAHCIVDGRAKTYEHAKSLGRRPTEPVGYSIVKIVHDEEANEFLVIRCRRGTSKKQKSRVGTAGVALIGAAVGFTAGKAVK